MFPPDFFEQKKPKQEIKKEEKKIIIDLAKEEEEDKELLELLEGKKLKINNNTNNIVQNNNYIKNIKNEINTINKEINIYELNLKGNLYKRIDNYYSNKNLNNNYIKKKEKDRIIVINKQKNTSTYTNSKNSHVGRILNLRKLKSQNNMTHEKNINEKLKDNYRNIGKQMPSTGKQVLYNKKYNIQNNNIIANDDTPSVSTLAHTKKYTSNSINTQNLTEDHNNKYRVNLLSAFSNSNNNIFIPFFPVQRPVSNLNIGGQLNMENFNSEKIKNDNKQFKFTKRSIEKIKIDKNMRQKISTAPSRKRIKKNYSNIFSSMNFYGQKFHHIKIDRSLMNNKLGKNMVLNYMNLGQNKFPRIKNSNQYNEIKKIFNMRNPVSISL